jgi:anti-sigma factor RsiW
MAPCDKYQAGIVAFFDNEARDEDLKLTAGHLQDCPECRAFCLELIGIRRALVSASPPSLSPTVRQEILDNIKADQSDRGESLARNCARVLRLGGLWRWAAVLIIGLLVITCLALDKTAKDLRTKLGAAEREVAAIHEQARLAESEERQRKAISALYFRMAELEERVNRVSPSQRASFPAQASDRSERQSNL